MTKAEAWMGVGLSLSHGSSNFRSQGMRYAATIGYVCDHLRENLLPSHACTYARCPLGVLAVVCAMFQKRKRTCACCRRSCVGAHAKRHTSWCVYYG